METFQKYPKMFQAIHKLSRSSENIQTIRKLSRNFPGSPETFWTIRKISRLSGNFPGYPEFFCANHPENIQTLRNLSRLSGNFLDHPENIQKIRNLFQAIRKLSGPSVKYPKKTENFKTIRTYFRQYGNFQDGPETSQCNFKGYAQKISGWQCHDAMMPRWFLGL